MSRGDKRKRKKLKLSRAERRERQEKIDHAVGLKNGTIIPVDRTKIFSRSAIPPIPDFYRDQSFRCKDCGAGEIWTAKQQQWWHEEQGGEIESIAVRCRSCRKTEKARKDEARRIHLEGISEISQQENAPPTDEAGN